MPLKNIQPPSVTLLDVQLAQVYLPYLVALARVGKTCTYAELIALSKRDYPGRPEVQRAIAVSTGRRLDVIKHYCEAEGLPDLASLVVGKASGECGSFPGEHADPAEARAKVFAQDWDEIRPGIAIYFTDASKQEGPRMTRREQATQLMADHYKLHRARYPTGIATKRAQIIKLLMAGLDPEAAFATAAAELSR
jgi:hypothetical protein